MTPSPEARALHERIVVVDALQASDWNRERLEELRRGGVAAVHVTVAFWENARDALGGIARWQGLLRRHGDLVRPGRTGEDILAAKAEGRTAVIFGFQNTSPFEDDLGLVEVFHALGVRVAQLTYNNQNLVGSGCYEAEDGGLTRFGREVVREMNRLGMVIDASHTGDRTTLDAIEASTRPIAITHANPLWFAGVVRNKSDTVLKALAESGGMLGFSAYPLHIGGSDVGLDAFCAMVARTAEAMGAERIGLGTDLCLGWPDSYLAWMRYGRWSPEEGRARDVRWPAYPAWLRSPADLPNLTAGLLARGFSTDEVAGIMGGNWLRFFEAGFRPGGAA